MVISQAMRPQSNRSSRGLQTRRDPATSGYQPCSTTVTPRRPKVPCLHPPRNLRALDARDGAVPARGDSDGGAHGADPRAVSAARRRARSRSRGAREALLAPRSLRWVAQVLRGGARRDLARRAPPTGPRRLVPRSHQRGLRCRAPRAVAPRSATRCRACATHRCELTPHPFTPAPRTPARTLLRRELTSRPCEASPLPRDPASQPIERAPLRSKRTPRHPAPAPRRCERAPLRAERTPRRHARAPHAPELAPPPPSACHALATPTPCLSHPCTTPLVPLALLTLRTSPLPAHVAHLHTRASRSTIAARRAKAWAP